MTDTSALRALRDKVKAGEWPDDFLAIDSKTPLQKVTTATIYSAFSGSIDAAKALHEAMLPGWNFGIICHGAEVWETWRAVFGAEVLDNPARAWLLAILDALIQEKTND